MFLVWQIEEVITLQLLLPLCTKYLLGPAILKESKETKSWEDESIRKKQNKNKQTEKNLNQNKTRTAKKKKVN